MAGDPKPRLVRASSARRLKDIAHLYLSNRPAPAAEAANPVRRKLRVGIAAGLAHAARVEVCANLAVQFARLGCRTLVVDLDPRLPNAGYVLGQDAEAYLSHLRPRPVVSVQRAMLGIRVVQGLAGHPRAEAPAEVLEEVRASECLLLALPSTHSAQCVQVLEAAPPAAARVETTMTRASESSRMFATWLAGARGTAPAAVPMIRHGGALDALLYVRGREPADGTTRTMQELRAELAPAVSHLVDWGVEAERNGELAAWARLEPYAAPGAARQPFSALYPEHPMARTFANLAQALLAGVAARATP